MAEYNLYDAASGEPIGTLTEEQLDFLIDHLEEESATDQDYYINRATIDMFVRQGADDALLTMLRDAMGDRQDMDIRWDSKTAG
jgi:hypothetical protein